MAQVNVGSTLRLWCDWSTRNVDELAAVGTAFVWSLGLDPLPGTTASDRITRRTIRYYISNGLMDPPSGDRRLATYGYNHLLQLLFVKARQHGGARLDEIREALSDGSTRAIEVRLTDILPDVVNPPLPVDPDEFSQPARLETVLSKWAYLTGRNGRWPRRAQPESLDSIASNAEVREAIEAEFIAPSYDISDRKRERDVSTPRHRVHITIDDDIELTVPADHPLVYDEDGRGMVLRGIRRVLRDYLRGS